MGHPAYPQHLTWLQRASEGWIKAQGHAVLLLPPAEPAFVGAYAIPDTYNPHDDKVYIFFREMAMEAGQWERRHIHARVARVCKVSHQSQHAVAGVPPCGFDLLWAEGHPKQGPTAGQGSVTALPPQSRGPRAGDVPLRDQGVHGGVGGSDRLF